MRLTKRQLRRIIREEYSRHKRRRIVQESIDSGGFSVYSEKGKYIESADGDLLQLSGMYEPKIIVMNGRERGSLMLHQDGSIYLYTNRRDQFFSTLQELCDYLNQNNFEYVGIDDY